MEITSDFIAMNFLILIYKNWVASGKPLGYNVQTKKFEKECIILWDRLIYEYIQLVWKGSSDSRIKNNIADLNANFEPVSIEAWEKLLNEIFTSSTINGGDISDKYMTALLYHFYCLNNQAAPDSYLGSYDVDHIIPQALFDNSQIPRKNIIKNNILNLGLLPTNENISKGKKRLCQIDDTWLKDQIEKYEFIENNLETYDKFSNVTNYQELFDLRKPIILAAFKEKRTDLLNN